MRKATPDEPRGTQQCGPQQGRADRAPTRVRFARADEVEAILATVEELLVELGDEAEKYPGIDCRRLRAMMESSSTDALGPKSRQFDESDRTDAFMPIVAETAEGRLIGVLTLSTAFAIYAGGRYGIIEEMYVRPAYRGRGVGERLFEAALVVAQEKQWHRLEVTGPAAESVRPSQTEHRERVGAVRFYERLGFGHAGPKLFMLLRNHTSKKYAREDV